jgi:hypothetical protein
MFEMFTRKAVFSSVGRATMMATVAAMALTVVEPSLARAGSAPSKGLSSASSTHGMTDFSSRGRIYRGGGGGAAAAAFAGVVGTGLAIAATQNRRAYYDNYDNYDAYDGPVYGGPAYYGPGPGYYGGGYGSYGSSSQFGGQPTGNW